MKLKLTLLLTVLVFCTKLYAQTGFPYDAEIRAYKHQDSLNFPKPNGILFIGASSIRLWSDLQQRFSGAPIIQRGVGGSELSQWVAYYTPYVLFPYHPRKIFLYAGENDIAVSGKTPQSVFDLFTKIYDMIRQQLPDVEFYYLSIKESPSRLKYSADFITANKLIKAYISTKPKTYFIDVATTVLNPQTMMPDSSLYKKDMLHLNNKGYDRWQVILQDYIK
ncbi:GDSL-type esterase/lipase family protein [Mucilaginibacter sp.]|uniref:GDSL-type esterase/lipase family protein n=1 Tax=Mucilaginibacter sp. TaxID=1882438 RepID=UPI002606420B|nr:GDSL-type esterase/lipase family protein [Mucilaginibacter sp.]MDB5029538.1 hypothetical protein [Mucilaginibacter sp.]